MPVLQIVKHPHAALRRVCPETPAVTAAVRRLAADMRETMLACGGIGLAAPQVASTTRLLVADVSRERNQPLALLNPTIVRREGEIALEEGCLSVPGVRAHVPRAGFVAVCGRAISGEEITIEAEELLAVCLQHEIDHLDGVLFFDRISPLKRRRLLHKYKKLAAENAAAG